MPHTACLHFWPCPRCGRTLLPRSGDCCVFCSYGDAICPPRRRHPEALA
ncbi:MAG TPA: GDCCVxC domain-containing (seleno)protein [Gemmatimonadales bacterium]|nr:GDCCVxC domain-containing (seleno)protein [Gemmatimonadales bacterium]